MLLNDDAELTWSKWCLAKLHIAMQTDSSLRKIPASDVSKWRISWLTREQFSLGEKKKEELLKSLQIMTKSDEMTEYIIS